MVCSWVITALFADTPAAELELGSSDAVVARLERLRERARPAVRDWLEIRGSHHTFSSDFAWALPEWASTLAFAPAIGLGVFSDGVFPSDATIDQGVVEELWRLSLAAPGEAGGRLFLRAKLHHSIWSWEARETFQRRQAYYLALEAGLRAGTTAVFLDPRPALAMDSYAALTASCPADADDGAFSLYFQLLVALAGLAATPRERAPQWLTGDILEYDRKIAFLGDRLVAAAAHRSRSLGADAQAVLSWLLAYAEGQRARSSYYQDLYDPSLEIGSFGIR